MGSSVVCLSLKGNWSNLVVWGHCLSVSVTLLVLHQSPEQIPCSHNYLALSQHESDYLIYKLNDDFTWIMCQFLIIKCIYLLLIRPFDCLPFSMSIHTHQEFTQVQGFSGVLFSTSGSSVTYRRHTRLDIQTLQRILIDVIHCLWYKRKLKWQYKCGHPVSIAREYSSSSYSSISCS